MSPREWKFRLQDITEAIERIDRYTIDMEYDAWLHDQKTIDAVIRNLEIIGEAASHIPPEVEKQFSNIPWKEMRGIRTILAHEYFGVDLDVIWRTIQEDLSIVREILTSPLE